MAVVLVTGAGRGLGYEWVKQLCEDNHDVIAICRTEEYREKLANNFSGCEAYISNLADRDEISGLVKTLKQRGIDIVINNAGVWGGDHQSFDELNTDGVEAFKVNAMAPFFMVQALFPFLKNSDKKLIVNISSSMGSIASNTEGGVYIYRASKAALNMITKSLAMDLRKEGITVIALHPGWVKTDMGGPHAKITTAESVASMRSLLLGITLQDTGRFIDYQGNDIAW